MEPVDSGLKELNDLMKRESNKEYDLFYYNDFDDYEDEIEFGSTAWIKMMTR